VGERALAQRGSGDVTATRKAKMAGSQNRASASRSAARTPSRRQGYQLRGHLFSLLAFRLCLRNAQAKLLQILIEAIGHLFCGLILRFSHHFYDFREVGQRLAHRILDHFDLLLCHALRRGGAAIRWFFGRHRHFSLSSREEMLHRSIMMIWERETILQAAILEATGAGVEDADRGLT
jgi:hypothetical protein